MVDVVKLEGEPTAAVARLLREAAERAEAEGWTAVVVLGYTRGKVHIAASEGRSTDALVGAMERAKWELFDRA